MRGKAPELAQEIGRAGFAVGAGDGGDAARLRAGQACRHLASRRRGSGSRIERPRRHAGRPLRIRRRQHGGGAARHGIGDELAARRATLPGKAAKM